MADIARDYGAAIALLQSHPQGHFVADASGGIKRQSAVEHFFRQRGVAQRQVDAEIGRNLIALYEKALVGAGNGGSPTDPRQLQVAARFINAYNAQRNQPSAPASGVGSPLTQRKPSVPQSTSAGQPALAVDPGTARLQAVTASLATRGLAADTYVAYVRNLSELAAGFSPAELSAFNGFGLGLGNVVFRTFYEHPECGAAEVDAATRQARYAEHSGEQIARAKQQAVDGKEAWIAQQLANNPSAQRAELEDDWDMALPLRLLVFDTDKSIDGRIKSNGDHTLALGRYVARARELGLTTEQAMTPIRLWKGLGDKPLQEEWQSGRVEAPELDELSAIAALVQQGIPLTERQANLVNHYLPPLSS